MPELTLAQVPWWALGWVLFAVLSLLVLRAIVTGRLKPQSHVDELLRSRDKVIDGLTHASEKDQETIAALTESVRELQEQGRTTVSMLRAMPSVPDQETK